MEGFERHQANGVETKGGGQKLLEYMLGRTTGKNEGQRLFLPKKMTRRTLFRTKKMTGHRLFSHEKMKGQRFILRRKNSVCPFLFHILLSFD